MSPCDTQVAPLAQGVKSHGVREGHLFMIYRDTCPDSRDPSERACPNRAAFLTQPPVTIAT